MSDNPLLPEKREEFNNTQIQEAAGEAAVIHMSQEYQLLSGGDRKSLTSLEQHAHADVVVKGKQHIMKRCQTSSSTSSPDANTMRNKEKQMNMS